MMTFNAWAGRVALWIGLAGCVLAATAGRAAPIRDGGIDPANLGKGDWIYFMQDATNKLGGNVASVTNENSLMLFYKSQGIRYFIVKAATSDYLFNGTYAFPQFTANLVNIAHSHGLLIFGYNRSYGSNVVGEIAISDYVFNLGADGFVWDAEAEWESNKPWIGTQGPAKAWELCSTVRSNWPTKFLAHAPFPIISLHSSFPYKEFGYWSDTIMPQIYHFSSAGLRKSPSAMINWSDVNWHAWQNSLSGLSSVIGGTTIYWTNSIKPIVPIHDVYGPSYTSPHPDKDVMEFMDYLAADPNTATVGGYKGVNFWRTDLHGPAQWAHIKADTSGNFPGIVNNIVMDDASATVVGAWAAVRTFNITNQTTPGFIGATGSDTNSFGTNYWVKGQGGGAAYMQFTPNVLVGGDYKVFQWHVYHTNASTSVPFVVTHAAGSTTVNANQTTNSGNWSLLGQFAFAAGTSGNIRVMDNFPEPAAVALVDGLKLVFVPPVGTPVAPSGLAAAAVSGSQINLGWTDNAANETAFVMARSTTNGGPYVDIASLPPNSTNYSNTNLSAGTTYYYVVRATNAAGASAASAQAAATTPAGGAAPSITAQPQSLTRALGMTATFDVTASGSGQLSYQWRKDGTNLAGAGADTYSIISVQATNAGEYVVVVSNSFGAVTSEVATLTIAAPPSIVTQPQSQSVTVTSNVTFTVTASGTAPLGYRWRFSGSTIPGATASTLTLTNVQATNAGNYSVVITNLAGTAVSANATLTVLPPSPIYNVAVSPGARAAIVTWNTLLPASSQVEFGFTAGYGSVSAYDAQLLTNHSVLLTGLLPGTNYFFRVISVAGGMQNRSAGAVFSTAGSLVLDNVDAIFTGTWSSGTPSADKYLTNYSYAGTTDGAANRTARYTPNITTPGNYDVFVWYPQGANRPTNAMHTVVFNGGSVIVSVNQTTGGGGWRLIAANRNFTAGSGGYVEIGNTGETGRVVMADGVRFTYSAGQEPPAGLTVPDWWAFHHFGSNVDGSLDHDGDGYPTWEEYLFGTMPNNAASHLEFRLEDPVPFQAIFAPHLPGRLYHLQSRDEFGAGGWLTLTNLPLTVSSNGQAAITITNANGSQSIYRLKADWVP